MISAAFILNNFNPKYFEDAEKFKPERWLEKSGKEVAERQDIFMPFFAGPRNCIGQHLAQIAIKIIYSEFIKKFDYKVSDGYVHRMTFRFLYEPDQAMIFDLALK